MVLLMGAGVVEHEDPRDSGTGHTAMADSSREPLLPPAEPSASNEAGSSSAARAPATPRTASLPKPQGMRLVLGAAAGLLLLSACTFGLTYCYAATRYFLSTVPPTCRKSAAVVVTSGLRLGEDEDSPRLKGKQLLVWSGKGHHADLMYDDLRALDLRSGGWHRLYDRTNKAAQQGDPVARWKAVAVFDEGLPGLVVSGGDAAQEEMPHKGYLSDIWWLPTNDSLPHWHQPALGHGDRPGQKHNTPDPRRAHAGTILVTPNQPTQLLIHGGRAPHGGVKTDVWSAELTRKAFSWKCLFSPANASGAGVAYPSPRKGHIAVIIPGDEPQLFIWGGRNDTAYFHDAWVFGLGTGVWTHWPTVAGSHPGPRDHLGGFYFQDRVYIYGGRGGQDYVRSTPLNDLWALDVKTHAWTQVLPKGDKPKARFLYSLTFYTAKANDSSAEDGRMLIFGGEGQDGCYMNDVWEFSLERAEWREISRNEPCQKRCRGGNSRTRNRKAAFGNIDGKDGARAPELDDEPAAFED